jgi:CheY-like chemotaxis protein
MKIILVEDHAAVAEMSCRLLREVHEHEVEVASTGAEALKCAQRFTPELILIDINLPDMDGYELARRLRANPAFDKTVLVALTGWGKLVDESRAQAAEFDAYFEKPMDFEILPSLRRTAG